MVDEVKGQPGCRLPLRSCLDGVHGSGLRGLCSLFYPLADGGYGEEEAVAWAFDVRDAAVHGEFVEAALGEVEVCEFFEVGAQPFG